MASNEIINRDSIRMAEAAANGNVDAYKDIARGIWKQNPGDANYWNGVREGANHILRDGYAQRTSVLADTLRDILPGASSGSSGFANAEIKSDGAIVFHKSGLDETIHPNDTAEREQKGQR